jgi:hypothetical protein
MAMSQRPQRTNRNPVNAALMHLRAGMRVLWLSDDAHYLLARVEAVEPGGRRGKAKPEALIMFPNGDILVTDIDRLHPLPRHDNPRHFRRRPPPIPIDL